MVIIKKQSVSAAEQAKLLRVLELILVLKSGRWTLRSLAGKFDTSERTMRRYIHLIEAVDLPLEIDFHNRYFIINTDEAGTSIALSSESPVEENFNQLLTTGSIDGFHEDLSELDIQIIHLMANGLTTKQIAAVCCRPVSTVETYRTRLFKKTETNCAPHLIKWAYENQVLKLGLNEV